jgi:hypothetical protein
MRAVLGGMVGDNPGFFRNVLVPGASIIYRPANRNVTI